MQILDVRAGKTFDGIETIAQRYGYENQSELTKHIYAGFVFDHTVTPPPMVRVEIQTGGDRQQ